MIMKSLLCLVLGLSLQGFVPGASQPDESYLTRSLTTYQQTLNSLHSHHPSGFSPPEDGIIESRRVCKIKNMKQYKKMVTAQLEAHRCLVRDTVVRVPLPDDIIVREAMPEFVVVPRCTGLCLDRSGCSCIPKKKRYTKVDVVMSVNNSSSQVCAEVKIEEHRGPCKCKCDLKDCHAYQEFDEPSCKCRCKEKFGQLKSSCSSDILRHWEEESCDCVCDRVTCAEGFFQDLNTCMCKMIHSSCAPYSGSAKDRGSSSLSSSIEDTTTSVSKYVGVGCVSMVGLSMVLTVYYLLNKKRLETGGLDLVGLSSHGGGASSGSLMGTLRSTSGRPTATAAAYTITINSQSSGNIDDAVIPLTENKTRF